MKVYIVQGSTGEYSDRRDWLVKGFLDEKVAQEWVVNAGAIARELFKEYKKLSYTERRKLKHPMDPHFYMDYTGTSYTYDEVEIEE